MSIKFYVYNYKVIIYIEITMECPKKLEELKSELSKVIGYKANT